MAGARKLHEKHLYPDSYFRLDLSVWALRRQPQNRMDQWDGGTYSRIFERKENAVQVKVVQDSPPVSPRLKLLVQGEQAVTDETSEEISSVIAQMLGIHVDASPFYRIAQKDALLGPLAAEFRGLHPPRFPSLFEALINAIACQQISLAVCITLLNRLAEKFGSCFRREAFPQYSFPLPEALASATTTTLRGLGFSRNKGGAIIGLARAVAAGKLNLDRIASLSDEDAKDALLEIPGIGPWSAEYVLLRGLGRLNIFPGEDVGARNSLQRFLSLSEKPAFAEARRIMQQWQAWQGFVYFHFLLKKLQTKGLL